MGPRRSRLVAALAVALLAAGLLVTVGLVPAPWADDRAEVRILGPDGERAVVDAEVADTPYERYVGLSDHDGLEDGEGMLFVHGGEAERTYVMRGMEFDIGIAFVGADGRITAIHEARAPGPGEDGEELRYSGRAKWVLEVPAGYFDEHGVEVGDEIEIDRG